MNGMVFGLAGGDLDILHHFKADMNDPAFLKVTLVHIDVCHTQGFLEELPFSGWSLTLQRWGSGKETERGKPLEVNSIFTKVRYMYLDCAEKATSKLNPTVFAINIALTSCT